MAVIKIEDLGKELEFTIVSEGWNLYALSDGTLLKIRPIIVKVFATGQTAPTGQPAFGFASVNVASATVPNELKKPSSEAEDVMTPVEFKPVKEVWNAFTVGGKFNLKVKLIVTKVVRTSKVNQFGEPIYNVKSDNIADVEPLQP